MAEAYRLGDLQVGKARHHHFRITFSQLYQRQLQRLNQQADLADFVAQPQADIGGDLVVAAATGVQTFAGIADFIGEEFFDVHVNIFQIQRPFDAAVFDVGQNLGHALLYVSNISGAQYACLF